jgi:hypothetical protein
MIILSITPRTFGRRSLTALLMLASGAGLGAVLAIVSIAIREFLKHIGEKPYADLGDLLLGLLVTFWNVLVGSVNGAIDGLTVGLYTGLATGAVYLLATLVIRPSLSVQAQRTVILCLVALAGGIGAYLGCQGILSQYVLWVTLAGLFFGLLAGTISLPRVRPTQVSG